MAMQQNGTSLLQMIGKEWLVRLARDVVGRLGKQYENELLSYPEYDRNRYNSILPQSQQQKQESSSSSSGNIAPTSTTMPTFSSNPQMVAQQSPMAYGYGNMLVSPFQNIYGGLNTALTDEYRRGIYARTPVPLGSECVATPLLESNVRRAFTMVMKACGRVLTLPNFLTYASSDVYDSFVELIVCNIIGAEKREAVRLHPTRNGKEASDAALKQDEATLMELFSRLAVGKDGYFHVGCPEDVGEWDPVGDGYSFGYTGLYH
jgi:hypothetical protein